MFRLTYRELKQAFTSECNRASNVSLGRAFFQSYEIANFLNAAYVMCIKKRLAHLDERYVSFDKRPTMPPASTFPNSMEMLIEFGKLYVASGIVEPIQDKIKDNGFYMWTCGTGTKIFPINKDQMMPTGILPYIINAQIHEYKDKDLVATFLCRPVNVIDKTRMSQMYQDGKYMPYIYYNIHPVLINDSAMWNLWTARDKHLFIIEMSFFPRNGGNMFRFSYDCIVWPEQISERDMDGEGNGAKRLAVTFGYEIALHAAQMAMESIGSDRSHTLAQVAQTQS